MSVFVTGVCGQLGHDCVNELLRRGYEVIGSDINEHYWGVKNILLYVQLDITDKKAVLEVVRRLYPDVIIHCAAWTAVDLAEEKKYGLKVHAINVDGTYNIAKAAQTIDAKVLYISTDYVFNGNGSRPWQPDDTCYSPLNVYGQSKLGGEKAVAELLSKYFIVRVSWLFGLNGNNFVRTMIKRGKMDNVVRVINDQIGTPTYTIDLPRLLADMIETEKYGYYHATNEGGYISWYDFCVEIYKQFELTTIVLPISTEEYKLNKAARPLNSRLDKSKLKEAMFDSLPIWQEALSRFLREEKNNRSIFG